MLSSLSSSAADRDRAGRACRHAAAALIVVGLLGAGARYAQAQVRDHLECYKIKDPQPSALYRADLMGLAAEPGCVVKVPAKLACVPTTKSNVVPPASGPSGTGEPNAFACYHVKCPRRSTISLPVVDQFGGRTLTLRKGRFLCAPAPAPPPPSCGGPDSSGLCAGTCPDGSFCGATSSSACGCITFDQGCGSGGYHCQHVTDSCVTAVTGYECRTPCNGGQAWPTCGGTCLPGRSCVQDSGICQVGIHGSTCTSGDCDCQ